MFWLPKRQSLRWRRSDPRPALDCTLKPLATANFSVYASPSPSPLRPRFRTRHGCRQRYHHGFLDDRSTPANDPWTLQVYSAHHQLHELRHRLPISAVTITCTAGFNPGPGGFGCGAPATLSTSQRRSPRERSPTLDPAHFLGYPNLYPYRQMEVRRTNEPSCTLEYHLPRHGQLAIICALAVLALAGKASAQLVWVSFPCVRIWRLHPAPRNPES